MKNALTTSAQEFYLGNLTQVEFAGNIINLASAVTTGDRANPAGRQKAAIDEVYNQIKPCTNYIAAVTDNTQDISGKLNELLYYLNSADANLRPGNSSWNRSYDPYGWVHCGSDGRIDNGNIDFNSDSESVYKADCFYLANDTDCTKYSLLCNLNGIEPPALYTAIYDGKPILYSSCNFDMGIDPNFDNYYECTDEVCCD